jgi:ATP-dependent Clp protease adaptor protein ClpS
MNTQFTYNTEEQIETDVLDMLGEQFNLIVWNDDINTFDWVIKTLIDICGHEYEQAEQCAMFIHFKGKYAVKSGDFDILKPMCDAITDRGIGATVEEMAA